eukprot:Gb_15523 [translate_table: standard]
MRLRILSQVFETSLEYTSLNQFEYLPSLSDPKTFKFGGSANIGKQGGSGFKVVTSLVEDPNIAAYTNITSSIVAAIGATTSTVPPSHEVPSIFVRPYVVFKPTTPHSADGIRIDPPPSVPSAAGHSPDATRAAGPDDEPPVYRWAEWGFLTVP